MKPKRMKVWVVVDVMGPTYSGNGDGSLAVFAGRQRARANRKLYAADDDGETVVRYELVPVEKKK